MLWPEKLCSDQNTILHMPQQLSYCNMCKIVPWMNYKNENCGGSMTISNTSLKMFVTWALGRALSQYKDCLSRYRVSHYKDKTVLSLKWECLYWLRHLNIETPPDLSQDNVSKCNYDKDLLTLLDFPPHPIFFRKISASNFTEFYIVSDH